MLVNFLIKIKFDALEVFGLSGVSFGFDPDFFVHAWWG